jgi:predicted nuclease of predicted toxin-antitoxin system
MRFIVDAQLPPALARWLADKGHEAEHVFDRGMASAEDAEIWSHALDAGAVVISKDEDFPNRLLFEGEGPTIVWVRLGNTRKRVLLASFDAKLEEIIERLEAGERLVVLA